MATDVSVKVGVSGERELRSAFRGIAQEIKSVDAQIQTSAQVFQGHERSQAAMAEKAALLRQRLEKLAEAERLTNQIIARESQRRTAGEADPYVQKQIQEREKLRQETLKTQQSLNTLEEEAAAAGKSLARPWAEAAAEADTGQLEQKLTALQAEYRRIDEAAGLAGEGARESAAGQQAAGQAAEALKAKLENLSATEQTLTALIQQGNARQQTEAARYNETLSEVTQWQKDLLKTQTAIAETEAELKKLNAAMEETGGAEGAGNAAEELEAKLAGLKETEATLTAQIAQGEEALKSSAEAQVQTQRQTDSYTAALGEAQQRSDEATQALRELEDAEKAAGEGAEEAGEGMQTLGLDTLAVTEVAGKALEAFRSLARGIGDTVESSMDFESAFMGIAKTVDGTEEQMAAIREAIRSMPGEGLPFSLEEIAGVAETAGQLGIATENVASFTRTMLDMGVSTNLAAEEAATSLARFTNITGTLPEDVGRLGSAIVALGNSTATDEKRIVEMSTRLASAGRMARLSEPQILGLAAAMSSVGIEAEAGGTAMTQTLSGIGKAVDAGGEDLRKIARIAGMSGKRFADTWKEDAAGALGAFIDGLSRLDEQGGNATQVLEELGMSGVRQSNMIRSLALANDVLTDSMETASKAWEENTALQEEAGKYYDSVQNKVNAAKASFDNLKVSIGNALLPTVGELAGAGKGVMDFLSGVVEESPELVQAFTIITGSLGAVTAGLTAFKAVQKALNFLGINKAAIAAAAPWAALAAAIGLTVEAVSIANETHPKAMEKEAKEIAESVHTLEETRAKYEERQAELKAISEEINEEGFWGPLDMKKNAEFYKVSLAIEETGNKLAELEKAAEATEAAMADENGALNQLREMDQADQLDAVYGQIEEKLTGLMEAYAETYQAAYESLSGQFGLFEKVEEGARTSTEDMTAALQSQTAFVKDYAENLKKVSEMGLDEGLVSSLADGSEQSAAYLASIMADLEAAGGAESEAGQAIIRGLNEAYAEQEAATEAAAEAMTEALGNSKAELEAFLQDISGMAGELNLGDETVGYGKETIEGYLTGLQSEGSEMLGYMEQLGTQVVAALQRGVNSGGTVNLPGFSLPGLGGTGGSMVAGSHAAGLDYVPYDNYLAFLHKGEMVVPAADAQRLREVNRTGRTAGTEEITVEVPVYINGVFTRREVQDIALDGMTRRMSSMAAAKGVRVGL